MGIKEDKSANGNDDLENTIFHLSLELPPVIHESHLWRGKKSTEHFFKHKPFWIPSQHRFSLDMADKKNQQENT